MSRKNEIHYEGDFDKIIDRLVKDYRVKYPNTFPIIQFELGYDCIKAYVVYRDYFKVYSILDISLHEEYVTELSFSYSNYLCKILNNYERKKK